MTTTLQATKMRGYFDVPGTEIRLPYTDVQGVAPGPTLLVTGGVHGGEYPGIESAIRFARDLDPNRVKGRVLVIHLSNPPAFFAKRQYVSPLDEKNLNRVFPGDPDGSPTERVAAVIMEALAQADFWVDLHGGDIHEALVPFTIYSDRGGKEVVRQAEAMARAYGIEHILESSSIAGGSYAAAAEQGIPAILAESGQVGQLDEEAVRVHLSGLQRLMVHLGLWEGEVGSRVAEPIMRRFAWVTSPKSGFFYRVIRPGDHVIAGQVGAVIHDAFGDPIAEIPVPQDGVVLFTVTSLAINAGDPLFAVAAP
ncbi:MAG: succinylglutamate desuccinylase/aspartoacylase family protein [Firmicutes bacterium]|nr:succinylglutamate desuccinylase/aspartoacylase family protein [Bacillota bacterium]